MAILLQQQQKYTIHHLIDSACSELLGFTSMWDEGRMCLDFLVSHHLSEEINPLG